MYVQLPRTSGRYTEQNVMTSTPDTSRDAPEYPRPITFQPTHTRPAREDLS